MVIAMFGGMIGEGVMKKGKTGHQYSVQRGRDFQQRWAYYLESLRSRRYSKYHNLEEGMWARALKFFTMIGFDYHYNSNCTTYFR